MGRYKVPLVWQEWGILNVEADCEEEAIQIALSEKYPLPDNGQYVDDSIQIDELRVIEKII